MPLIQPKRTVANIQCFIFLVLTCSILHIDAAEAPVVVGVVLPMGGGNLQPAFIDLSSGESLQAIPGVPDEIWSRWTALAEQANLIIYLEPTLARSLVAAPTALAGLDRKRPHRSVNYLPFHLSVYRPLEDSWSWISKTTNLNNILWSYRNTIDSAMKIATHFEPMYLTDVSFEVDAGPADVPLRIMLVRSPDNSIRKTALSSAIEMAKDSNFLDAGSIESVWKSFLTSNGLPDITVIGYDERINILYLASPRSSIDGLRLLFKRL